MPLFLLGKKVPEGVVWARGVMKAGFLAIREMAGLLLGAWVVLLRVLGEAEGKEGAIPLLEREDRPPLPR